MLNAFSWQLSTSLCEDFYWSSAKQKNADACPSYSNTREVKQRCYTTKESFTVTDTLAAVKLRGLFDHTILRVVQPHDIVLDSVAGKNIDKIVLVSKWGLMVALDIGSTNKGSPAHTMTAICF